MRPTPERLRAILLAGGAAAVLALAGCGGDDSTSTSTGADATSATSTAGDQTSGGQGDTSGSTTDEGDGGSGDSTTIQPDVQPITKVGIPKAPKGGDDSIQTFGDEADDQTSAEVVAGLKAFLDARAKGDWERACAFLVPGLTEQFNELQQQQSGEELSCADLLESLSAGIPKKALKGAAKVTDVGGVRVKGDQAFVVFKGDHNLWYAAPMGLVDGVWKSGSIAPSALP